MGFPGDSVVKNPPAMQDMQEIWVHSLGQEDPLEEGMAVFLPEESHGQRNLVGYNPWGCKESDRTERLHPGDTELESGERYWGRLWSCQGLSKN